MCRRPPTRQRQLIQLDVLQVAIMRKFPSGLQNMLWRIQMERPFVAAIAVLKKVGAVFRIFEKTAARIVGNIKIDSYFAA